MRHVRTDELTPRESEVIALVAAGLSSCSIAAELGVSPSTVHAHVRAVMVKLGASTRGHAVVLAASTATGVPHRGLRCGQRRLLLELASGKTVSAAARSLHISRRTAHRWLEQTRRIIGADSNVQALIQIHAASHSVAQIDDVGFPRAT